MAAKKYLLFHTFPVPITGKRSETRDTPFVWAMNCFNMNTKHNTSATFSRRQLAKCQRIWVCCFASSVKTTSVVQFANPQGIFTSKPLRPPLWIVAFIKDIRPRGGDVWMNVWVRRETTHTHTLMPSRLCSAKSRHLSPFREELKTSVLAAHSFNTGEASLYCFPVFHLLWILPGPRVSAWAKTKSGVKIHTRSVYGLLLLPFFPFFTKEVFGGALTRTSLQTD